MINSLYECFQHWSEKGTVWLYSDPHFSDKDLPDWPSDEEQIKMINSKVGRKDTLIILGDIGNLKCIPKLRGYKVLIAGNHDTGLQKYQRQRFKRFFSMKENTEKEVLAEMASEFKNCKYEAWERYEFYSPFEFWMGVGDNCLFDEVYAGPLMISKKIILSHEPVDVEWAFNIHGHNHNKKYNDSHHLNCCSNIINFTPISLNKVINSGMTSDVETIHELTREKAKQSLVF